MRVSGGFVQQPFFLLSEWQIINAQMTNNYKNTLSLMFSAFPRRFAISLPMGRLPFSIMDICRYGMPIMSVVSTNPRGFRTSTALAMFAMGPRNFNSIVSIGGFFV